ncbi:hypothetical protein [Comamonas sp. F1-6]|uniref:hypothetical protein n=1 Tax=Comamonas sp. F1-6 TaxID=673550 RepID=UPI0031D8A1B2
MELRDYLIKSGGFMKREIRFKEWGQNVDEIHEPTDFYISKCDASLINKGYSLRTDGDGNIICGNDVDNSSGKILMLGDSFVESLYVDEKDRFASCVERNLHELGFKFNVWNGGYSGATSLHLYVNLITKYLRYSSEIKLVMLFQPSCDGGPLNHSRGYWNRDKFFAPIIDSRNSSDSKELYDSEINFDHMRKIHRVFYSTCREYSIPVCLVKTPFRDFSWGDDPDQSRVYKSRAQLDERRRIMNALMSNADAIAKESSVDVLDLEKEVGSNFKYFYDSLHLNNHGSYEVGRIISNHIVERGLVIS